MSGTSMATPQVAGAAADLLELHPHWSPEQVKAALAEVDFDAPSAAAPHPGGADRYQYDLVVTDDGTRSLTAHDPFVGPGVRAVLDVLLPLAHPE
jgi:subtilisin family serine protease